MTDKPLVYFLLLLRFIIWTGLSGNILLVGTRINTRVQTKTAMEGSNPDELLLLENKYYVVQVLDEDNMKVLVKIFFGIIGDTHGKRYHGT